MYNGAATAFAYGRGPTGAEGGISDETRGCGWVLRNRAETAFIAPDGDPEKAYFTYLTNDALARWEGSVNITGTAYQGSAMWNWGKTTGNHQAGGDPATDASPLHFWDTASDIVGNSQPNNPFTPDVEYAGSAWMQDYFTYGLARAKELGFAAGPLFSYNATFDIGRTLDSGLPILNAAYRTPALSNAGGGWYRTWPAVVAALKPGYANGTPDNTYYPGGLPQYYKDQGYSESYVAAARAIAALAYSEPRGDRNWAWLKANDPGITNDGDLSPDPRWAFVPRTDSNTLPAIPP